MNRIAVGDGAINDDGSRRALDVAEGDEVLYSKYGGTEVTVELNYEPPAGHLGITLARLLGEEPRQQVEDDLRHFKQIMEAGEIPTVQGQPSARGRD